MLKNEMMIQGELDSRVKTVGEKYSLDEEQRKVLYDLIFIYHSGIKENVDTVSSDEETEGLKSAIGFPHVNLNIYIRGFVIDVFVLGLIKLAFSKEMTLEHFALTIKNHIKVIENEDACVFKKIFQHESYATKFKVDDVYKWFFSYCNNEHKYWKCSYNEASLCPNNCTFDKGEIRSILNNLAAKNVLKHNSQDDTYKLRW